jgi:hypothetical protein
MAVRQQEEGVELVVNGNELTLSTGKKITLRRKTGAHHMVENRLLSVCIPSKENSEYGVNIGDMVAMTDIRAVVAIEAINGTTKDVPGNLAGVIELMSEFEYEGGVDEWSEFKQYLANDSEKIKAMAKNLLGKTGSETELVLP